MKRLCLVFVAISLLLLASFSSAVQHEGSWIFRKVKSLVPLKRTPEKQLWARWQKQDNRSTKTIDHRLWADFLRRYVKTNANGINLVSYGAVTKEDRRRVEAYLDQLSHIKIDEYNQAVQEAFWINLYNALTVNLILKHYPVKSILDIGGRGFHVFHRGPWNIKLITVERVPLSLNDIEHRILRPIWNDARIHYAVNCAAYSCPNLHKKPYDSKHIDRMLNAAAKDYVNNLRGVTFKNGKLFVSSIYDWYRDDFGDTDQHIIDHLIQYANPELKQKLQKFHTISGYDYDWALNVTK